MGAYATMYAQRPQGAGRGIMMSLLNQYLNNQTRDEHREFEKQQNTAAGDRLAEIAGIRGQVAQGIEGTPGYIAATQGTGFYGGADDRLQSMIAMGKSPTGINNPTALNMLQQEIGGRGTAGRSTKGMTFEDYRKLDEQGVKQYGNYVNSKRPAASKLQTIALGAGGNMMQQHVLNQDKSTTPLGQPYRRSSGVTVNTGIKYPKGQMLSESQNIDMGLPSNSRYWLKGDGTAPIKIGNYSDAQMTDANFANQLVESGKLIDDMGEVDFGITDQLDQFGVPSTIAGLARSPEAKVYETHASEWILAHLRKDSGAAIPEHEFEAARKKYFPKPGDTKEVIEQKRIARHREEQGTIQQSGGAYGKHFGSEPEVTPFDPNAELTYEGLSEEDTIELKRLEKLFGIGN